MQRLQPVPCAEHPPPPAPFPPPTLLRPPSRRRLLFEAPPHALQAPWRIDSFARSFALPCLCASRGMSITTKNGFSAAMLYRCLASLSRSSYRDREQEPAEARHPHSLDNSHHEREEGQLLPLASCFLHALLTLRSIRCTRSSGKSLSATRTKVGPR